MLESPAPVIEANFRPQSDYERQRLGALRARIVEVYCDCPPSQPVDVAALAVQVEGLFASFAPEGVSPLSSPRAPHER